MRMFFSRTTLAHFLHLGLSPVGEHVGAAADHLHAEILAASAGRAKHAPLHAAMRCGCFLGFGHTVSWADKETRGSDMLVDHRTYTVRPGTLRKQLALYEKHGLAVQKRHFGEPLAWLTSETGDVNTYVHIWVYKDAADRTAKRAALFKDPEWLAYLDMNAEAGYLIKQESKLMSPAPFAPISR
jgi:hypothetical protein